MNESSLLKQVRLLGTGVVRLWRNNTGVLMDATGRPVRFGLCPGSSDAIGYKSVTITQEMVGQRIAQFVAIETKSERGRVRPEQQQFVDQVTSAGGLAGVARSVEDAKRILEVGSG